MVQRAVILGWMLHCFALSVAAQSAATTQTPTADARLSPGPYYIGVPIHLQVTVSGFDDSPEPTAEVNAVDGVQLHLVAISPQVSSSVHITNGQVRRWKEVKHTIRYEVTATRAGLFRIGPIIIKQGNKRIDVERVTLRIGDVPQSEAQQLRVLLPQRPLWVGERIPVSVEWWINPELGQRVAGRRARVPLFDQLDRLRFEDKEDKQARASLIIDLASGAREFPATLREDTHDGNPFFVVTVTREMTPLAAGKIQLEPASIIVQEAIKFRRNLFGERVPIEVRRTKALSQPLTLEIQEPPTKGRPTNFAGVVGTGFSVTAAVERSVVNVGDPITIRVTVRGDGPLDTFALPTANELGLADSDFGVVDGANTGKIANDGSKQFDLSVRPLHTRVSEIPELQVSWFDAGLGKYQSTSSQPIALSVKASQVVGSDAVVVTPSAAKESLPKQNQSKGRQENATTTPTDADRAADHNFTNLAIETHIATMTTTHSRPLAQGSLQAIGYALAVSLLLLGFWWRSRRSRDPSTTAARQQLRTQLNLLRSASTAGDMARVLRTALATHVHNDSRAAVDDILAECDAIEYGTSQVAEDKLRSLRVQTETVIRAILGDLRS
jgi:hypothetical protein